MTGIGSLPFAPKDPKSESPPYVRPPLRRNRSLPSIPPSPAPSSIPFSWEQQPGIPKNPRNPKIHSDSLLPLPPPLRSASDISRKKRSEEADPFAVALAECTKKHPPANGRGDDAADGRRRAAGPAWAVCDRFRFIDLFGSCKAAACSVSESAVYVPRSSRRLRAAEPPVLMTHRRFEL